MKIAVVVLSLLLCGCGALPRDPEGTSDRIAGSGAIRVGVVRDDAAFGAQASRRLLARLADETAARPLVVVGSTETLFKRLEQGQLDIVLAPVDPESPWTSRVTPGPAIAGAGSGEARVHYRPLMRNGENRWIMTVEQAARAVAERGAGE